MSNQARVPWENQSITSLHKHLGLWLSPLPYSGLAVLFDPNRRSSFAVLSWPITVQSCGEISGMFGACSNNFQSMNHNLSWSLRATTERKLLCNRMKPLLNTSQNLLKLAAGIHLRVSLYSNMLDKNIIFIFITRTKIIKPNRFFLR